MFRLISLAALFAVPAAAEAVEATAAEPVETAAAEPAAAAPQAQPRAAGPLQVATTLQVESRTAARDGTTSVKLVPATRVTPGDRVTVAVSYRNTGPQALGDVVLANPVPPNLSYRAPAAGSPPPELSVDGQRFGQLATLSVRGPNGARPATADDVTAVRWRLSRPLPAGGTGQFAFQAVLK
jgi:uncharacterized repeat protein (TIGR01451 family)